VGHFESSVDLYSFLFYFIPDPVHFLLPGSPSSWPMCVHFLPNILWLICLHFWCQAQKASESNPVMHVTEQLQEWQDNIILRLQQHGILQ